MAATYDDLRAEILRYLGRDDLADLAPTFILHAEARMNRDLRLKLMEREAYYTLRVGQRAVALPDKHVPGDWDVFLQMRDLRLMEKRGSTTLRNIDFCALDNLPDTRPTGRPCAYGIRGREMPLYPIPDAEYILNMTYYAEIPPLGDRQPANDILLRSPDLYLYGALVASAPYARSSVPVELWEAFYVKASQSLSESDVTGRFTANIALRPIRSV
jgi:hypothetical protein